MDAAETLEDARRFAEARAAYKQLAEEFPASLFAAQARQRADYLAVEG
jgi:outer membrane protein assembly factor BamD (BamD/ComL family)